MRKFNGLSTCIQWVITPHKKSEFLTAENQDTTDKKITSLKSWVLEII